MGSGRPAAAQGPPVHPEGVGGGAGRAGHAVNDFRVCAIEACAPLTTSPELTARINDDGWENCCADWLKASRLGPKDMVLVFSVGAAATFGPRSASTWSEPCNRPRGSRARSMAGGRAARRPRGPRLQALPDHPQADAGRVTPHTEGVQAVVWHLLISHPLLAQ